jgi:hypothetical protein
MSKLKDLALLGAVGVAPFAIVGALASDAGAQTAPCPDCDALNAKPGAGGPGFGNWSFACPPGNANGVISVKVTTKGQPGVWTAAFGDGPDTEFEGSTTLSTSVPTGTPIVRWLKNPQGEFVIAPKFEVIDCPCDETVTTSSTVFGPPATPIVPEPPSATVPGAPTVTSVAGRSTTPPNKPGTLPATGGTPAAVWVGGLLLIGGLALGFGANGFGREGEG